MTAESKHWIAMGGEHGCLPDNCCTLETLRDAVDSLAATYELSRRQRQELRRTGSVELRNEQGGEYCEVSECNCDDPECHNDN